MNIGGGLRAGAAIIAVGAITVWLATTPRAQTPPPTPALAGVPVTAVLATARDVPNEVTGIGTVQAYNSVLVRTRVDGTLMKVPVTEGQTVKPGDVVAVVDPRPYQAALDMAMAKKQQDEAALSSAKSDLARTASLMKQDFASRQLYDQQGSKADQLVAQIAGDQAAIEAAQLNLSYAYITSPIPGRVGLRQMDPGNIVHAADNNGIVTITQDQPISVVFTLPQDSLSAIMRALQNGEKLEVVANSGDDKTKLDTGTLLTPDNSIDPATGTFKLKADFPNTKNTLWPGQFVNAHLVLGIEHNVLAIPREAVQHGPDGLYVYVVQPNSTVQRQAVTIETHGDVAVITSGLKAGEQVVLQGQSRLDNGMRVTVEKLQA